VLSVINGWLPSASRQYQTLQQELEKHRPFCVQHLKDWETDDRVCGMQLIEEHISSLSGRHSDCIQCHLLAPAVSVWVLKLTTYLLAEIFRVATFSFRSLKNDRFFQDLESTWKENRALEVLEFDVKGHWKSWVSVFRNHQHVTRLLSQNRKALSDENVVSRHRSRRHEAAAASRISSSRRQSYLCD